MVNIQSY